VLSFTVPQVPFGHRRPHEPWNTIEFMGSLQRVRAKPFADRSDLIFMSASFDDFDAHENICDDRHNDICSKPELRMAIGRRVQATPRRWD